MRLRVEITLEIPEEVAREIAPDAAGVSQVALESLALEGVRSGRLSEAQAQKLLGFGTRYRMDGFLKQHGIYIEMTLEEVHRDTETALAFSLLR